MSREKGKRSRPLLPVDEQWVRTRQDGAKILKELREKGKKTEKKKKEGGE